jgi:hypothetical protein
MPARLPDFVIVGAMRSGTTSLARWMGDHPEIHMAPAKELHYFDRGLEHGLTWYAEQFKGATDEKAVGEATPNYLYDPDAIARMAEVIPQARLLAVLRNPVDRAYSHYWHRRARGRETLAFTDAVAAEERRLEQGDWRDRADFSYLDRGRYASQLERAARHYSRDAMLVLLFDDLRDDPAAAFSQVCRFLDVDASVVPDLVGRTVNEFQRFRSPRLRNATKNLPSPVRRVIGRLNSVADAYPPMPGPLRRDLVARFAGERAALSAWLGRDLSAWGR